MALGLSPGGARRYPPAPVIETAYLATLTISGEAATNSLLAGKHVQWSRKSQKRTSLGRPGKFLAKRLLTLVRQVAIVTLTSRMVPGWSRFSTLCDRSDAERLTIGLTVGACR